MNKSHLKNNSNNNNRSAFNVQPIAYHVRQCERALHYCVAIQNEHIILFRWC